MTVVKISLPAQQMDDFLASHMTETNTYQIKTKCINSNGLYKQFALEDPKNQFHVGGIWPHSQQSK